MRTAITITLLLLLSGCETPTSNVGFTVKNVHGPGLKGGNYVTCANGNAEFNVNISEQIVRTTIVGDLCPAGTRW